MTTDCERDLAGLALVCRVVALAREAMIVAAEPGMTTRQLDAVGERVLREHGAVSAPIHEYNFPGTTCISVGDEVAHGIPGDRVLRDGDLVNIDVSAELGGYFGDTGASIVVGTPDRRLQALCDCARSALMDGIGQAKAGGRLNLIGRAIQDTAKAGGYTVVRNLTGHGIGRKLHEDPHNIPGWYNQVDRRVLRDGMVLAIESFVSTGAEYVRQLDDGWTLKTPDGSLVAQYEHTIVVRDGQPLIMTAI